VIHVLAYDGVPIAAAERMERLSESMAAYTPAQQDQMSITAVEVLE
jgi:hypothetical protein